MEISKLEKVLILPGASGNMSMLYDRRMCINYYMCHGYYYTITPKTYLYNVNINSTLKQNVLNIEALLSF